MSEFWQMFFATAGVLALGSVANELDKIRNELKLIRQKMQP